MRERKRAKKDNFADVVGKIQQLNCSQQQLIADMLVHKRKMTKAAKKKLLRKSFGIWADRKDVGDNREYVDALRKSM